MARLIFALLIVLGPCVRAQIHTLDFLVKDAETNDPLPFVTLAATPGPGLASTNERGRASLRLREGNYLIRITFTGYEDVEKRLLVDSDGSLRITMEPSVSQLGTVVVTDRDESAVLSRPRMGVERLTAGDLESIPSVLGERDVLRALQLLPGVSSAGEASNGISVRGGTLDQNLLLFDGAPVFTPTHLFGLFTVFTPDAVGSLDLYRGNIPARFGGRIASVVDVRSRAPVADATVIKGGIGLVASHLSVETPLGADAGAMVALRGGFNDFVFPLIQGIEDTRSRFGDGVVRLRFAPGERHTFNLSGFYSADFYQIDLLTIFGNVPASSNQYAYRTLNGTATWNYRPNERLELRTRLFRSDYRSGLRFPQFDDLPTIEFESDILSEGAEVLLSESRPETAHRWFVGLSANRSTLEPGRLVPNGNPAVNEVTLDREIGTELAAFAEDDWAIADNLNLGLGLRYVYYLEETAEYFGLEPRLGLSWRPTEQLSLKGSYARSRQYLQNIYNATTPLPTSRWKVADANVGPQTADLYGLGASYFTPDGNWELQFETFYRNTQNLLEYRPGADFFLNPRVQDDLIRGRGRAYGAEVTATRRVGKLTGELSYTYARAENQVTGERFNDRINRGEWYPGYFDQPHTFAANLTLNEGKTHELGLNFTVHSNRPYTVPNGFVSINDVDVPLFLERNNDRLPTYHRVDFSWTIHNIKRERRRWIGDWVFTVYNLYGRDNAYNIYFEEKNDQTVPLGIFSGSPFAAYKLSIFGSPVLSLAYKFTFRP